MRVVLFLVALLLLASTAAAANLREADEPRNLFTWPWQKLKPKKTGKPGASTLTTSARPSSVPTSAPTSTFATPWKYPMFKQCDSKWGKDVMQVEDVCQVGCFMSSVSMALSGRGITVPTSTDSSSVPSNPGTLNAWLKTHNGYVPTDLLDASVIPKLSPRVSLGADYMHKTNDLSYQQVAALMASGNKAVVANVHNGRHFVLLKGYLANALLPAYANTNMSNAAFACNDPGFDTPSYTHADIVGYRIFSISAN